MDRTSIIDSVLLTSCQSLTPSRTTSNGKSESNQYSYINEQTDYWNIEDILAEEELVPCIFKDNVKNLGFLESLDENSQINGKCRGRFGKNGNKADDKTDLAAGTKVSLPLWLATSMAQRDLCDLKNPEYLTPQFANIIDAGPEVVNLRR